MEITLKSRRVKTLGISTGIATTRKIKTLGTDNYMDCGKTEWTGHVYIRKLSNTAICCELLTADTTQRPKDSLGLTSFLALVTDGTFFLPLCLRSMFRNGYVVDDNDRYVIVKQA